MKNDRDDGRQCIVFGVESGVVLIGLGILIMLFGIIPLVLGQVSVPTPVVLLFIGFGLFLVWVGLTK